MPHPLPPKPAPGARFAPLELRLFIDGGFSRRLPVRCHVDPGSAEIEAVYVDLGGEEFDIVDNLRPEVVARLSDDAWDELGWEEAAE